MSAINKQHKTAEGLYHAANELIEWHIQHCQQTIENRTSQVHRSGLTRLKCCFSKMPES